MKNKLAYLALAAVLTASPLAFAADPEKGPGKDSTSTTVPAPKTPSATEPAVSTGSAGAGKDPGKESTATAVPVPPKDDTKKENAK